MIKPTIEAWMRKVGAYPKLLLEVGRAEHLELVEVAMVDVIQPNGEEKSKLKFIVKNAQGQLRQWITGSIVVADRLREVEAGQRFTVEPIKNGAKRGYKIELKGE